MFTKFTTGDLASKMWLSFVNSNFLMWSYNDGHHPNQKPPYNDQHINNTASDWPTDLRNDGIVSGKLKTISYFQHDELAKRQSASDLSFLMWLTIIDLMWLTGLQHFWKGYDWASWPMAALSLCKLTTNVFFPVKLLAALFDQCLQCTAPADTCRNGIILSESF